MLAYRSTFELDTTNSKKPILRLETVIDGVPSYQWVLPSPYLLYGFIVNDHSLEIIGAPLQPQGTSLGLLLATNFKDLFDKIGMKPARWF